MSRFVKSVMSVVVLASSVFVSGTGASVQALTSPGTSNFPLCATDGQEFCIQKFEFTPTGGTLREVTPLNGFNYDDVNVRANFPNDFTGPNGTPEDGMLGPLSLNFDDIGSFQNSTTKDGLRDGVYHVIVRTGDFDPSQMTVIGEFVSYSVVQGTDGYFTIDLTAKPKPIARVVAIVNNGVIDDSLIASCETQKWVGTCKANDAHRLYLNVSFSMFSDVAYRAAIRGSWITTNASTTQISYDRIAQGEFNVLAKGPHYVPADFVAGEVSTDVLNPAYFEEFLPYPMISKIMSSMSGQEITAAMAKDYLTESTTAATSVMTGSISVSTSGETPVDTPRELILTPDASGVRVNFNLDHFSAPNPSLKFKIPAALAVASVAAAKKPTVAAKKMLTAKVFADYAKLTVKKTSTISLKVSKASKKYCSVVTKKVKGVKIMKLKGLKKGSCRVTVTVTPKKGLAKRSTLTIQIT
jgi:hypothetical protein